jgi:indolepyruvate decarboxylase
MNSTPDMPPTVTAAVRQLEALLAADVVPHATLMWGKSLVDESSPTFLGIDAGAASDERVRRAIEEAPVLVTAGVQFTDMVSGFFTQHIDPMRTIDVGHNQSVVAGQFFAPLDVEAALEALKGILERRGIRSRPLPPASSDSHFELPAREHPLTQKCCGTAFLPDWPRAMWCWPTKARRFMAWRRICCPKA